MLRHMYDTYVVLPESANACTEFHDAWKQEVIRFVEKYGFPCTTAWDCFHIFRYPLIRTYVSFSENICARTKSMIPYAVVI